MLWRKLEFVLHRYGMMWPGVEPTRGKYNQSYINAAKDVVTK